MTLNKKIVLRESAISGKGLYAVERIPSGEVCWEADEDEEAKYWVPIETINSWAEDVRALFMKNAWQVKPGVYSGACLLRGAASAQRSRACMCARSVVMSGSARNAGAAACARSWCGGLRARMRVCTRSAAGGYAHVHPVVAVLHVPSRLRRMHATSGSVA